MARLSRMATFFRLSCHRSRLRGRNLDREMIPRRDQMKRLFAVTTATLAGVLLAAPLAHASIVNPLTFNAAVNAAQAVDPTLAPPANDGKHDFAVGGFEGL